MIRKLLIANRGEIAVRVIRAARELGIRTVAVFSDADAGAPFALLADESRYLGPPEPRSSYLDIDKIVAVANVVGADAIHPGYGFLSERPEFARACEQAGLVFVGPTSEAMRQLGSKLDAKRLAVANGVPIAPSFFESEASEEDLKAAAGSIGYPVLLKAAEGGGGRGMRVVETPEDFDSSLRLAREEARNAFGDDTMIVEKLIEKPRHVEVQVLADRSGRVAALFERECSIQRRHQKLIEESPSPAVEAKEGLWERLRDDAIKLVRAVGYTNAGTVEFMIDKASGQHFFLEVNARIQVEHPVTEAVTGVDLVQWQLRIAAGEELALSPQLMAGDRSALVGHAIEARVVAEAPEKGFLPSTGRIVGWLPPAGAFVRVDSGLQAGCEVTRFYDSLIAKVIAHGANREEARMRLIHALEDFHILGVRTNIEYTLDVLRHSGFVSGRFDTGFLGAEFAEWQRSGETPPELGALVAAATSPSVQGAPSSRPSRSWDSSDGFRNARS